jgi:hypothetical protein
MKLSEVVKRDIFHVLVFFPQLCLPVVVFNGGSMGLPGAPRGSCHLSPCTSGDSPGETQPEENNEEMKNVTFMMGK